VKPIILFRPDETTSHEMEVARTYFDVVTQRNSCPKGSLVVGRYSVLPFYKELDEDLRLNGSKLVNSHTEHEYIADLGRWSRDLGELTPRFWTRLEDLPEKGPFVLKGQTNSKKNYWDTMMFAETKRDAVEVWLRLKQDMLLEHQQIYIREFVPLNTYLIGHNGMPVTEEYRFFVYNGVLLCGAYYWASYAEDLPRIPKPWEEPGVYLFVHDIVKRLTKVEVPPTFYVLDVARKADGELMVVELNDAQMSGLSLNDPDDLYRRLAMEMGCLDNS
jgi:hypothetical protein